MIDLSFDPRSDDPAVKTAFDFYAKDDARSAARLALETLSRSGDPAGLRLVLALAQRHQGRQRDAVTVLETAVEAAPARADLWTLLGLCRRDLADRDAALRAFRNAIAADPAYARAQYQLAVTTQELDRHEEAVSLFQRYLESDAGAAHGLAWSLLGVAFRNLGRFAEAVSAAEQAIKLEPDDIPSRNALVITHYKAGDHDAALVAAKDALKLKDRYAMRRFAEMDLGVSLTERLVPFNPQDRTKNIISFSLWGNDPVYTHGAIVNAQLAPHVYPGWRCRFYADDSVPFSILAELRRLGAEVQKVDDPQLKDLKPLWRFLVSDDPTVERFVCRDTDSRLNVQESLAVDEWLKSGMSFHIMRDHIFHMEVILAGMWGGVAGVLPNIREMAGIALNYSRNKWNDQEFLRDVVWPLIRNRSKVHDSLFGFLGAGDFSPQCRLPGQIHVGGAIKKMSAWPGENWATAERKSQDGA